MIDRCAKRPRSAVFSSNGEVVVRCDVAVSCACNLASFMIGFERRVHCIVQKRGVLIVVLMSALNEELAESLVVSMSFTVRSLWASLRRLTATVQLCLTFRSRRCFALTLSVLVVVRHLSFEPRRDGVTVGLQNVVPSPVSVSRVWRLSCRELHCELCHSACTLRIGASAPWQCQLRDDGCSVILSVETVASTAVPRSSRVSMGVPSCCIEVKSFVWNALELWVRGVLDDGNDHSSNKLSVLKALTCLEKQSARSLGIASSPSPWLSNNSTSAFVSVVAHGYIFGVTSSTATGVSTICFTNCSGEYLSLLNE